MNSEQKDIFQRITDLILKAIEEGADSYRLPWRTSGGFPSSPINAVSQKAYRGINILVLWATAQQMGYQSGLWATYKQWQELGAQVRKGEKSTHVVFWKFLDQEDSAAETTTDTKTGRKIPLARDYSVFHADQVDGWTPQADAVLPEAERIESAEEFFQTLGIDVQPGGNRAYYNAVADSVHMPALTAFEEPRVYYSVLAHEATHWSGAPPRLDRDLTGRFGTESYAMEELIAELGAAFLCAALRLPSDPRQDHAPYLASWLKVLKNDKRAIVTAAAKAQEAVDWMQCKTCPGEAEETA